MVFTKNKNLITITLILIVSFFLQAYVKPTDPADPLLFYGAYFIKLFIEYIALFICVLLITKEYFNAKSFFKTLCATFVYAVVKLTLSSLNFSLVLSFVCTIINPLLLVVFVLIAVKWITKCKFKKDINLLISGAVFFVLNGLFNILSSIATVKAMENMQFYALLSGISVADRYGILASACFYIIAIIVFIFIDKKSVCE